MSDQTPSAHARALYLFALVFLLAVLIGLAIQSRACTQRGGEGLRWNAARQQLACQMPIP